MTRRLQLALFALFVAFAIACARSLPEPDSEGAQLYVQYCSGSGCHDPIPPARDGMRYWENQYTRMLDLMARSGSALPSEAQGEKILDYLRRNAAGARR